MATKKLQGITIEIAGNTTKLTDSLKDVNKSIASTNSELKNINSLLKFDTSNTTLLAQKQKILEDSIASTTEKLRQLRVAKEQADQRIASGAEEKNTASYRELEREIVATEQQLGKLSSQLENVGDGFENVKNAQDSASSSTLKFGDVLKANLLSEAITFGISKLVDSFKKLADSMVDLGKSAVNNFADYEQLIGGVETLFKDSADTVEQYANNAYKTAGLSANEYMETVTSFSASLLQSLGGDTEKSAKVADMAITDMSDNANKMGTSMEMIQNAYQGFAKQNYTMLDNLKLGYGGTKTEMERLLADASAISGVKYDISSLNDVYSAIHVIQEEMGIAGTTARESTETISGSLNSVKSSWQNLLTGLASGNTDIKSSVKNLSKSITDFAKNIVPVISTTIKNMIELFPELINEMLPLILELGTELIVGLIEGISSNSEMLMSTISDAITQIINVIILLLPQFLELGIDLLVQFMTGIANSIPKLVPTITEVILKIIKVITDNLPEIIIAGIDILLALIEGLIDAIPTLIEAMPEIISSIVVALTEPEMLAKLVSAALELILALGGGLIKAIPDLLFMIPTIISNISTELQNKIKNTDWKALGKNILDGILNGMINFGNVVKDTIKKMGDKILGEIKAFFGIKSPSRLMKKEVGKFLAEGIAVGFEDEIPNTISDVQNAMSQLNSGIQASINPTINPQANSNPLIIQIENFNNTRETDIESLAEELEFYRKNSSLAVGGSQ